MNTSKFFRYIALAIMLLASSAHAIIRDKPGYHDIESCFNKIKEDILEQLDVGVDFTQPIDATSPLGKLLYLVPLASDYPPDYVVAFFNDINGSLLGCLTASFLEYLESFDSCRDTLNSSPDCVGNFEDALDAWETPAGKRIRTYWGNTDKANARAELDDIAIASSSKNRGIAHAIIIDEPRHYDIQSLLSTIKKDIHYLVFNKGINFTQPIEQASPLRKLAYLAPLASDYPPDYLVAFFDNFKTSFLECVEDFDSCIGTLNGPPDCFREIFGRNTWEDSTGECLRTWWVSRGKANALAELDYIEITPGSRYDESIEIKNLATGECIQTRKFLSIWRHACVKLDNNHLASGSLTDNTIKIWALRMDLSPLQRLLIGHLQKIAKNNQTIKLHDDWKAVLPERWAQRFAHILS